MIVCIYAITYQSVMLILTTFLDLCKRLDKMERLADKTTDLQLQPTTCSTKPKSTDIKISRKGFQRGPKRLLGALYRFLKCIDEPFSPRANRKATWWAVERGLFSKNSRPHLIVSDTHIRRTPNNEQPSQII